jgi:hypothetical protein
VRIHGCAFVTRRLFVRQVTGTVDGMGGEGGEGYVNVCNQIMETVSCGLLLEWSLPPYYMCVWYYKAAMVSPFRQYLVPGEEIAFLVQGMEHRLPTLSFHFWYREWSTDGQSFPFISGTEDGEPMPVLSFHLWYRGWSTVCQSFRSTSGTGEEAPMVNPFLQFLVQGMEHRCSVLSFHFWYREWSTVCQSFPSISGTGDGVPMISPFLRLSVLSFHIWYRGRSTDGSVLSFNFWYRGWSTDVQSVLLFLVQRIEHRCSVRPSISGTGDGAPMVSPFLLFLVLGMEHRLSVLSSNSWYRGWSTVCQSIPSITDTEAGAPFVSPSFYFWYRGWSTDGQSFPSISGTGDGALMVNPSLYFWYRGWSPDVQSFLLFLVQGIEHLWSARPSTSGTGD